MLFIVATAIHVCGFAISATAFTRLRSSTHGSYIGKKHSQKPITVQQTNKRTQINQAKTKLVM
jgi:hypothetical protein